jgi:acetylornithine/N-succinyldiaminopimelate aminotransferase
MSRTEPFRRPQQWGAGSVEHREAGGAPIAAEAAATKLVTQSSGADWLARYSSSLMGVFGTPQRVLVRGAGCLVWDADGKEYLDLLGGIAVNALGHAHPFVTSVISSQLATLGHVSNFFTSPTQIALAEKLLELSKAPAGSKVFFANSGTEANEAAFKLARRNNGDGGKRHQDHRARRRIPRPDHGRLGAHGQRGLPRAVRATARRRGPHSVR